MLRDRGCKVTAEISASLLHLVSKGSALNEVMMARMARRLSAVTLAEEGVAASKERSA
jgi:hypothetical protein